MLLRNNMFGIRGHKIDSFKQCLFVDSDKVGWTWLKGTTDPDCSAPQRQGCPGVACKYQFTFAGLHYGVNPWGLDTGAPDMPVDVGNLKPFVGTHDITHLASDDMPGHPAAFYARHSLIYDLFLTTEKPEAGKDISHSITDEVIIMMNYNPGFTDFGSCSSFG